MRTTGVVPFATGRPIEPATQPLGQSSRSEVCSPMSVSSLGSWMVFLHVVSLLAFVMSHGISGGVAFMLRRTRDRASVRTLLRLSELSGLVAFLAFVVLIVSGVIAGFTGNHWGSLWLWASLALLAVVYVAMMVMAGRPLKRLRELAEAEAEPGATDDAAVLGAAAWNPVPTAAIGIAGLAAITWLMMFKPF